MTTAHHVSTANAYKQGEHICSLYDTENEQVTTVAQYIGDGLRQGERCLFVATVATALRVFDRRSRTPASTPSKPRAAICPGCCRAGHDRVQEYEMLLNEFF